MMSLARHSPHAGHCVPLGRGRLSVDRVRAGAMSRAEYERQRRDGYVPELGIPNPAVIPFMMGTATLAVNEFLHP